MKNSTSSHCVDCTVYVVFSEQTLAETVNKYTDTACTLSYSERYGHSLSYCYIERSISVEGRDPLSVHNNVKM